MQTNTHGAVHDADRVVAKLYSEERVRRQGRGALCREGASRCGALPARSKLPGMLSLPTQVDLHASNMWVSAQPPAALLYVGIPFTPLHPAESIFRVAEVYQIPPGGLQWPRAVRMPPLAPGGPETRTQPWAFPILADVAVIGSQFHGAVRFRLEMSANGPGRAPAPCAAFLDFLRDSNKQHTASVLLEAMCLNLASKVVGTPVYSPAAFLNHLQGAINPHGNRDTPWTAGQGARMT